MHLSCKMGRSTLLQEIFYILFHKVGTIYGENFLHVFSARWVSVQINPRLGIKII